MILSVENLHFRYKEKIILNGINLTIEQGKIYAIAGQNGTGKTTLLKCLSGNLPSPKNTIQLFGKDLFSYKAKALAQHLSVVSQRSYMQFEFSVYDIVAMGRFPYQTRLQNDTEADIRIIEEAMQMTDISHLRNMSVQKISGGEFQRVMIARAIAQQTDIMLLDEPVSNLDLRHQLEALELLVQLKNQQKTIIIILHDLNLINQYADHLFLLQNGGLFAEGKPKDILTPDNISKVFSIQAKITEHTISYSI